MLLSKKSTNAKKDDEKEAKPMSKEKLEKLNRIESSLSSFLFGGQTQAISNEVVLESETPDIIDDMLLSSEDESDEEDDENPENMFFIDTKKKPELSEQDEEMEEEEEEEKVTFIPLPPAWVDTYTEELNIQVADEEVGESSIVQGYLNKNVKDGIISGTDYEQRMRTMYKKLHPTPKWARLPVRKVREETEDGLIIREELLETTTTEFSKLQRSTTKLVDEAGSTLPKTTLEFKVLRDANEQEYPKGKIISTKFHPASNLALVLSGDYTLRLFQVDGNRNPLMEKILINETKREKYTSAHFSADGKEVYSLVENATYFYVTDLTSTNTRKITNVFTTNVKTKQKQGKQLIVCMAVSPDNTLLAIGASNGSIKLVSRTTKFVTDEFQSQGNITCIKFTDDGRYLLSTGHGGLVYIFDVAQKRPLQIFQDDGSTNTTALSVSRDSRYIATGSTNGVVNVYDWDTAVTSRTPKPIRSMMNLTTTIDLLTFNFDTQILAMGSSHKENSFRLAHVPSFTVFSNFPNDQFLSMKSSEKTITATDFDFNRESDYFVLANGTRCLLYNLPYFKK
jgi:U3 small nucleolar RNA-associated protein 18